MSAQDWSDYHAWPISQDMLGAAWMELSDADHEALYQSGAWDGQNYITPREAIEDAALAMLPAIGAQWLTTVYELEPGQGAKLLGAIQAVRQTGA